VNSTVMHRISERKQKQCVRGCVKAITLEGYSRQTNLT
jgi:hypothetical protein